MSGYFARKDPQKDEEASPAPTTTSCDNADMVRNGYPSLVRLMHEAGELAIFRSFDELHLLNLLRIQAELQDLEYELEGIRKDDDRGQTTKEFVKNFRLMRKRAKVDGDQHRNLIEIAGKIREYGCGDTALLDYLTIRRALPPGEKEIEFLQEWLRCPPPEGDNFLKGREARIWYNDDLLSLHHKIDDREQVVEWIESLLGLYYRFIGRHLDKTDDPSPYMRRYSDQAIAKGSRYIAAVTSSLLPTLVMLVLNSVHHPKIRLGLIVVFTTAFSTILAIFTSARKMEIFAATAAFAAVEVVFIGSTLNGNGSNSSNQPHTST